MDCICVTVVVTVLKGPLCRMLGGDGFCVHTHVDVCDWVGPEAQLRQLRGHGWHHRSDGGNISDAHIHGLQNPGWPRHADCLALHDERLHSWEQAAGWSVWNVASKLCDVQLWVHASPMELRLVGNRIRVASDMELDLVCVYIGFSINAFTCCVVLMYITSFLFNFVSGSIGGLCYSTILAWHSCVA